MMEDWKHFQKFAPLLEKSVIRTLSSSNQHFAAAKPNYKSVTNSFKTTSSSDFWHMNFNFYWRWSALIPSCQTICQRVLPIMFTIVKYGNMECCSSILYFADVIWLIIFLGLHIFDVIQFYVKCYMTHTYSQALTLDHPFNMFWSNSLAIILRTILLFMSTLKFPSKCVMECFGLVPITPLHITRGQFQLTRRSNGRVPIVCSRGGRVIIFDG